MIVGIPRERKQGERRVALTPDGAQALVSLGHRIIIESDAGKLSGFENSAYQSIGAEIAPTLEEVWNRCDLVVKVKEPAPEEIPFFRPGLSVFCFLHLAVAKDLTKALVEKGMTGIDYDLLMLDDGRLPILEPMSIIAGKLSIQCGASALQAGNGGRGVLLGGTPGVSPGKVIVLGAGASGSCAAKVAIGMGADVTVFDINTTRLQALSDQPYRARTLYSHPSLLERELENADLVIGAVLIPGALAPKLLTRQMVKRMHSGSVLVDICIDQGGVSETSRPTTISEPTYVEEGVVHYCVPNMPALVPRTSTVALTNASFPWLKQIVSLGVNAAIQSSLPIKRSVTTLDGKLTNKAIAEALGMEFTELQ